MKVLINTPKTIKDSQKRGIGFYTQHLLASLKKYDQTNSYQLFKGERSLPQVDLIHYPYFDFFQLTLPLVKKIKTVVTIHDVIPLIFPNKFPKGIKGSLKLKIQKQSLKTTNAVITDSNSSKKDIIKHLNYPPEKTYVIYLAPSKDFKKISDPSLLNKARKKYRLPPKFILYVGDVNWNKNLSSLIKACLKIKIPLVLIGKAFVQKKFDCTHPENKPLVQVQRQIKKNKQIYSLGFVKTKDLVLLYNLATAYCQPSYYEGFGLPVLEAMTCGCPVVCSQTSSLPEVAGDAAKYFNPYSLDSICERIRKIINDPKIASKLIEKGIRQVKKFSWEKTALETIKVYKKVLKS